MATTIKKPFEYMTYTIIMYNTCEYCLKLFDVLYLYIELLKAHVNNMSELVNLK